MTKLSVNINKVALIRNSRGEDYPDLVKFALDCEEFGADGITVHPRPDERHVKFRDVPALREVVRTELNVEGYPSEKFLALVEEARPDQCTLVPDPPGVLTSSEGWDTILHASFLKEVVERLHFRGIRVSLFVDPVIKFIEGASLTGTDRIELYTGKYARQYEASAKNAVKNHIVAASLANELNLGVNAGHDLNLHNLEHYAASVHHLKEVSIGHALISDALYYGLQNTIGMYKACLKR